MPYPKGYIVPKFKSFSGEGIKGFNPDQHLAHFMASCGNTASSEALLLRQFPQSLSGPAFEWYYSLENGSIRTWDDLCDRFRASFAVMVERVFVIRPIIGILGVFYMIMFLPIKVPVFKSGKVTRLCPVGRILMYEITKYLALVTFLSVVNAVLHNACPIVPLWILSLILGRAPGQSVLLSLSSL